MNYISKKIRESLIAWQGSGLVTASIEDIARRLDMKNDEVRVGLSELKAVGLILGDLNFKEMDSKDFFTFNICFSAAREIGEDFNAKI